jgi:general secretion pathway protein H
MPISATGNSAGFTLVETLVVIVIIGLLASVVVLTMGQGGGLRADARALAARVKLLSQEAVLDGKPTGVLFTTEGYAFYGLKSGKWIELAGEPVFARQVWRKGVTAEITRVANDADKGAERETQGRVKNTVPTLVFDPTGIANPFKISLQAEGESFIVSSDEKGGVSVHGPN